MKLSTFEIKMDKKAYSRKEVAAMLGISIYTLINWEKKGLVERPIRVGKRVFYTQERIDNILK